jgi:hypothetical protein
MTTPDRPLTFEEKDVDNACRLVGRFFYHWGPLESLVDSTIANLFGVDQLEGLILTANIQFRDKTHIISTALAHKGFNQPPEWQRPAKKLINRLGRLTAQRNLLAHAMFQATKDGFVRLYKVEAKGQFDLPRLYWGPKDFEQKYLLIDCAYQELKSLAEALKGAIQRRALVEALLQAQSKPTSGLFALGLAGSPTHRTLLHPDLDPEPTSQETNPQNGLEPQAKPEAE